MEYDIIITGCGAAGLSMISHLINSPLSNKQILVIDNQNEINLNKTWCFWDASPSCHFIPNHQWKKIKISNELKDLEHSLDELSYFEVRASDFRASVLKEASKFKNIHFTKDHIHRVESMPAELKLSGEKSNYIGQILINSIPGLLGAINSNYALTQNFKGWRINTQDPVFNPEIATLMDFTRSSQTEVSFFYILPFSENQALIEYTRLSKDLAPIAHYDELLKDYIQKKVGIKEYTIDYEEFGSIPMSTQLVKENTDNRIFQIGTAGGDTKPTTGYTFKNIQSSCRKIIHAMELGYTPKLPFGRERFNFYDNILLNIIKHEPSAIPAIFFSLFKYNPVLLVLKFLDEKTSLREEISIFLRLPWAIFLRHIFSPKI